MKTEGESYELDFDKIRKEFDKYNLRYWDFRFEDISSKNIVAWNKEVKRNLTPFSRGFCSRVLFKNSWGFACSSDMEKIPEIIEKSVELAKINTFNEKIEFNTPNRKSDSKKTPQKINFSEVSDKEKINFLLDLSNKSLNFDQKIKSSFLSYSESTINKKFLSCNCFIEQELAKAKVNVQITSKSYNNEEEKFNSIGHTGGYEFMNNAEEMVLNTCKRSVDFLKAKQGVAGEFPVLIDGKLSGLLVHEALGHAVESDFIKQGASCLSGKLKEKLSEEYVNICDDATENDYSGWGCFYYDDEGIKARKNYIIKGGILNSYLHNIESSSELNLPLTGNARAENVFNQPIIRMTNTYIEKGTSSFEDMVKEIKKGYFMAKSSGGQVEPVSGNFQFSASDVFCIENGEIKMPVKSMSFGGNLLQILRNIIMVENRYDDNFPGMCGKLGQSVRAGGTCPKVYLKQAIVG